MQHEDTLSRAPVDTPDVKLGMVGIFNVLVRKYEVLMYQHCDANLSRKIETLKQPECNSTRRERGEVQGFVLREGILYKKDESQSDKDLYVVPQALRKALVIKNHDLFSHFGVDRTLAKN